MDVLKIGPGLGVVTRELAAKGARVVCVEADRELEPVLRETLADAGSVEIVMADFLKLDLPEFITERGGGKWVVVGNLPYYITSPILAKLIEAKDNISSMVLMVQREVAQRLAAPPGSDDYGALSVFVQFHCDIKTVVRVSKNVFYPIPDVDSEVIELTVVDKPRVDVRDECLFFKITRAAFGKRRKTLLNALSSSDDLGWTKDQARAVLESAGIDPERRGETLSLIEFARISNAS